MRRRARRTSTNGTGATAAATATMEMCIRDSSLSELVLQARMDMVDLADRADVTLACDIEPVSYTHLDVYKRQLMKRSWKLAQANAVQSAAISSPRPW